MACYERMSYVRKHLNSNFHGDTFSWNVKHSKDDFNISSGLFDFCGYHCYLVYKNAVLESWTANSQLLQTVNVQILIRGYQAPRKTNISCQYSFFMKNGEGELYASKTGEITTKEKTIHILLYKSLLVNHVSKECSSTISFSWCESVDHKMLSQGMQTEPGSGNAVERGTQTEEKFLSNALEICNNSESSKYALKPVSYSEINDPAAKGKVLTHEECETYKLLETLSNDLGIFYEDKTDPDCMLKVGETRFPAHRSVLSARSTVFAAMFHHNTSESQNGEVIILDVDPDIISNVIYYMYTGKVRGLSPDTAAPMYIVAEKYALIELREKCLDFLLINLNIENLADAALISHAHAEIQLENNIARFIEENLEKITGNETWIRFSEIHHKIANKLLCSALIASKRKNDNK